MAYASLVCLSNFLEQNLRLNLIPQNSQYIKTLLQETSCFQDFLEKSSTESSKIVKCLENQIKDAAYKVQDIVDSHVADRFLDESAAEDESFTSLFRDLDEVMEEINSIKQEMQIEEIEKVKEPNNEEPPLQPLLPAGSSRAPSHGMNRMVGLEDGTKEIKTRLVNNSLQREIIPLVGMGGIGKITLATKVYGDKHISSRFEIRGWATVSPKNNLKNILLNLLDSIKKLTPEMCKESRENLAEILYKNLKHMRYFIVLDDVWDTQVWYGLKRILPDDGNGSRILLTTRLEQVAEHENSCPLHSMRFMNDEESWGLFSEKVFGKDCCPLEFEEVGKEIVQNCRGLPLAINVIGGYLSKASRTKNYRRSVAENLSEAIASNDEHCSRVLYLSYNNLPYHLKGIFLYMGIFPEDYEIKVSVLLHLWVASGFIKQVRSKSLEEVRRNTFWTL